MADVKWIKIYVDMFDHKKIKFIRKLPEGNDILLCWVMLLSSAGKCNMGGHIFLTTDIPYTAEMLADEFNMPPNTVRLALETFNKLKMVELDNGIYIKGWEEYQNIDGMEKIRILGRERAKKHYDKKKLLLLEEKPNVRNNVSITQPNATDIDLELDIEKIKDIEKKPKNTKNKFFDTVLLSSEEHEKLINQFGDTNTNKKIEKLNNYIMSTGKKYKSHYHTILNWSNNENNNSTTVNKPTLNNIYREVD